MILLELTGKEYIAVKNGLIKEMSWWKDEAPEGTSQDVKEKNVESCMLALEKLENALLPQEDVLITSKDLNQVISSAKGHYLDLRSGLCLSGEKVKENDLVHISLANALIMWLNGKNLLKRLAKFDYTDDSAQFEEVTD